MNTSHRSIWNSALGAWVAVSEITRTCGKRSSGGLALASGGVLALGLLLAPSAGFAQNYGATGGDGGGFNGGSAGSVGVAATGGQGGVGAGAEGTSGSINGGNATQIIGGGGAGYSQQASGDIATALQGGNGGSAGINQGGGGAGGDGVRIVPAVPGAPITVNAAVTGGRGGAGANGIGGAGGGGAGVVLLGDGALRTNAAVTGGAGGNSSSGTNGAGGGGAGVILQGAGQLTANAAITGGAGGSTSAGNSGYAGDAGVGVLLVGNGRIETTADGVIAGGAATGAGQGGAGVSLLLGGTVVNAGTIRGGSSESFSDPVYSGNVGGAGSGGATGFVSPGPRSGQPGAGITGAGFSISNSGTIEGGTYGSERANAITFTGGTNSLTLQSGSVLRGAVQVSSGATASILADHTGLALDKLTVGGATTVNTQSHLLSIGALSGAAALSKIGTGTLALSGSSNYSGAATVSAGTLAIAASGALGSGTYNIAGGELRADVTSILTNYISVGNSSTLAEKTGTLSAAAGKNLTLSGTVAMGTDVNLVIGSSGQTGIVTLAGATGNHAAATVAVNYGTLRVGSSLVSQTTGGAASTTVASGATLDVNDQMNGGLFHIKNLQGAGVVSIGALDTSTLEIESGSFSGVIQGAGTLRKNSSGALVLSGLNTYAGKTEVVGGELRTGLANAMSASSAVVLANDASAGLNLNSFDQTIGSLTGGGAAGGNVTLGGATLTAGGDNTSTTYAGAISGTGTLTKTGSGTLTLTGANDYSGGTLVSGGTLQGNTASLNGNITNNAAVTFSQVTDGIYVGAVSGSGALTKTGAAVLTLTGPNAYSGSTTINNGALRAGGAGVLGASSALTLANTSGATLDLNNFNQSIGSLAGGGTSGGQVSLGSARLTLGGDNTSTTYAGSISGTGGLTKSGTGTMTLTGTNTYSGATIVSAGSVLVNGSTANAAFSVASGATLGGRGTVGAITVAAGGTLQGTDGQVFTTGALALDNTSQVHVALGAPSNAKLFQVNGDLTLDGQLHVTDLGGFGAGVYRLFDYTGALTNNGLDVSSAPAGATLGAMSVQTAVANQVNLINASGQTLQFWDGEVAGHVNNSVINGGSGTWTATSGNWTKADGTMNAAMTPAPGFAIFQGSSGTVTASHSAGALAVTGLQFASDGYVLQGDAITFSGTNAIVRVGNGSGSTPIATISAALTGSAALEKTDSGTLILTGANSYSGGTTVSGGTLQGNTDSLKGNITNNAAVTFNQTTTGTYAGAISGTGALSKTGGGVLTLTGANNYSGGTTVSGGTLQGDTASLQGDILNHAAVHFDQAAAGTYAGAMNGSGMLVKSGAGTLTLTGANSYSGGTTVNGGTLQGNSASLQGNISNNAAVTFDQAASGTYAGAMSGLGALTKLGAGNLVFTGTSSYSGVTSIRAGTLSVNGSIANSALTVYSGGTLGGTGTVGSTLVAAGGTLAPGNSIGTLNVAGNLSLASGATYRAEVNEAGNSDRINVTGSATLDGATLDVHAGDGTYAAQTTYSLLTAAGGISGSFGAVTSNLAFLTPTLSYGANSIGVTMARNDIRFTGVAQTPNQKAAAAAFEAADAAGATGDMRAAMAALTGLTAAQARAAYDSASGASLVGLRSVGKRFATGLGNQLHLRLGSAPGGLSGAVASALSERPILLAANSHVSDAYGLLTTLSDSPQIFSLAGGADLPSASASQGRGFWLRGSGANQRTDTDGNAVGARLSNSAVSAGFDTQLRDGVVVGAALSHGNTAMNFNNRDTGKARSTAMALYGSYSAGPWSFKGSGSAAWNSNHMDRTVTIGSVHRVARADFNSNTLSAHGEASYSLPVNGWTLQPLAGMDLSRDKAHGFTETGADALNLRVAGQAVMSSKLLLGARAGVEIGRLKLEPRAIWAHEFGQVDKPMTAQFQGAATASPFQVLGVALERDTLVLGLGASGNISQGMDLFADVQLEHNSRQRNAGVMLGLRASW